MKGGGQRGGEGAGGEKAVMDNHMHTSLKKARGRSLWEQIAISA